MILDGKKIAQKLKSQIRDKVLDLKKEDVFPGLAVILVGEDQASQVYVNNKKKACQEVGIYSESYELDRSVSEGDLLELVEKLNKNRKISGVLVQLPLPDHIDERKIIEAIDPKKDVDCFHPENVGRMFLGYPRFLPCTPGGILEILEEYKVSVEGKDCVIVGKSNIVGKPLAVMLANLGATVTICHSKTSNLKEKTLQADILISAVGRAGLITSDMVKRGAVIIDVGINRRKDGKIVGDVDFEGILEISAFITPVPGGVGPMTIAILLKNTVLAAKIIKDNETRN